MSTFYMKIVISTNNIATLHSGRFAAFGDPGLSIFILRCARAGHGGYIEKIWQTGHITNRCPLLRRLSDDLKNYLDNVSNLMLVANGTEGTRH